MALRQFDPELQSVADWVLRLNSEELPLFAHTARSIASISEEAETSVSDMAQVILNDSTMTARVLRMANSAYFNPTWHSINTVSRAVVVLGFDTVRSIALSIAMIDTVLSGISHDRALEEMARSYHAAVQAKELAQAIGQGSSEEIFIAALLHRLGNLVFWCFPYGYADALDYEYSQWQSEERAEKEVLGFPLAELTRELSREWHLGSMLASALEGNPKHDLQVALVEDGYQLARAAERGWQSDFSETVLQHVTELVDLPLERVREIVYDSAQIARRSISDLGLEDVDLLIPKPPERHTQEAEASAKGSADSRTQLQLSLLRELTSMLSDKVEINSVLGMVLEGICRGLDMDRCLFALATREKGLQAKFVIGENKEFLLKRFRFPLSKQQDNLFHYVLRNNQPMWLDRQKRKHFNHLITPDIRACLGNVEAFIMPIRVGGVPKGILYADAKLVRHHLNEALFMGFRHFGEHVNIAFKLLAKH